ncbi:glyoxalase [Kitasatospora herbaricolor]|uniref:VOC family protein n=1 Tax=Kitasatospora herbaricolor TaxID=68217 RepID=UPI00174D6A5E|nr:VOC family protein [Kitasatospora herbaricolor]MDQ0308990.1 putative enzyme related to lactoylglutathione lyase [Kitasatospora herbaricolor]GGV02367.1 glyoxalase [Kitasatospora herbaricolor]
MIGKLQCIVLDCHYPAALARFYAALLGGEVDRPDPRWSLDEDWSTLHTEGGPVVAFQRVQDFHPPQWPDPAHPQQIHLDIEVADIEAAEREVIAHGGAPLKGYEGWRVYADPAGHPFCLIGATAGTPV